MKKKANEKGFSFAEVLVVVSILLIMSSLVFVGRKSITVGRNIEMSAYHLASEIRKMQSYTLNLQDYNGSFPLGGWGVHISDSQSEYFSYADLNENQKYDPLTEKSQSITLPNGVLLDEISVSDGGPFLDVTSIDITFEPPDSKTHLFNSGSSYLSVRIKLQDAGGIATAYIKINQLGLIEVVKNP
jgi:prepilin-type N-terminal cleavage/methylation domain-containing protein